MKIQNYIHWQFGKIVALAILALVLTTGWGQTRYWAAAQEPDSTAEAVVTTVEPISPVTTPGPIDDSAPSLPDDETVEQEPDASPVDVIVTVEPVVTAEPTEEPEAPTPNPTGEPDDIDLIIDPPAEDELGEPIMDENYIARDDLTDEEGGEINIFDLTFVAARYDSDDPAADINLDGTVDIFDLTILASHYGQTEPADGAAIITPTPLPQVEASGGEFGIFDLAVETENFDTEAQYYTQSRPLKIGVGINYVKTYDAADSTSAPDPYTMVAVGGVRVRTSAIYNQYQIWPYWRLGWWRYAYFPWSPSYSSTANYYSLPIEVEIRDDDGYVCYGYYGCRYQCQYIDVSPSRYYYTKHLTVYPSSCMVVDEAGTRTYGSWINSDLCRVYLQSWGTEWPRGYMSYYIDALWE
jgi:hypothetical protein